MANKQGPSDYEVAAKTNPYSRPKVLRKKTGQFQNSQQAGYSQGAGQEIGRLRTDPSHPANAERNAELARRAGKTVSKRTYYGATSNPVRDLDNPSGG